MSYKEQILAELDLFSLGKNQVGDVDLKHTFVLNFYLCPTLVPKEIIIGSNKLKIMLEFPGPLKYNLS
jgi:hypothetical protein